MHKLTGTKSQAKPEPDYAVPASRPRKPKDLSPDALSVFTRLCSMLRKRRALTSGDCELLRVYAINHERHARAIEKIQQEGEVRIYTRLDSNGQAHEVEKTNLWLPIAITAEKNMVAILDRLGLSPLNRAKVKPTGPEPPKAEKTPEELENEAFEALMKRK